MAKKAPTTASATSKAAAPKGAAKADAPKGKGPPARGRRGGATFAAYTAGAAKGRHLVIVESPSKAKTINKYLGSDYVVLASVGHVRDLPDRNPKGVKNPVPGVDLERNFAPTYIVSEGKERVVSDLKRAAKDATGSGKEVWFATDLDREGEAIAWHLASELGIRPNVAKRVMFAAITKAEIDRAFANPHAIDEDRVNAQQARRILDRIVGYQVSPLLWKKVARGLSAGRVQSVAVRLVVEREREIRAFVPDERWSVQGIFAPAIARAQSLRTQWQGVLGQRDEKGNGPSQKLQNAWLAENACVRAELIEVAGKKFDVSLDVATLLGAATELNQDAIEARLAKAAAAFDKAESHDLTPLVQSAATLAGLTNIRASAKRIANGRGPARWERTLVGDVHPNAKYVISSLETRRTSTRPLPPFITSTLQQSASTRFGFGAQRTMRAAQQLYEGIDVPGEGPMGLITYMRTDSTHLSREAIEMARTYIARTFGDAYLPEKPNFFSSSNKDAQEAHEAIRPTTAHLTPAKLRNVLSEDQFKLYTIIYERFVACQMTPAQWDQTTALIVGGIDASRPCTFRAGGRILVFDGFYKVTGVPASAEAQTLPALTERAPLATIDLLTDQSFSSPPPRYSEASLIKVLEEEGIGRPSTYASIISVIQDRKYVDKLEGRLHASDLGEVVTDKLIEGFPDIMDVGYTRDMEAQLDKVEEEHLDWVEMLRKFYGKFQRSLASAEGSMSHAKAETRPAPKEFTCPTCAKEGRGESVGLVYRFGKNGRFLSCSLYPTCTYAAPVDREGKPQLAETVDVACPKTGRAMVRKTGRFGQFLATPLEKGEEQSMGIILNIDKKGKVAAPSVPPLSTELPCPTCESPLNLRNGLRGPWLGCSRFPKCRGRGKWAEIPEAKQKELELALKNHERAHPVLVIRTLAGVALTDDNGKSLATAPTVEQLLLNRKKDSESSLEEIAADMGV
jgi:DNA topoisomerase-1